MLLPGKHYEDWKLDDPAGKTLEEIRPIRDEIKDRVTNLRLARAGQVAYRAAAAARSATVHGDSPKPSRRHHHGATLDPVVTRGSTR
jgi:hypothetical protein